jgi:O-acetylserine/cysteine efflux transporter
LLQKNNPPGPIPLTHALIAFAVVFVWGTNFVVIKYALNTISPMLLGSLRFGLAFVPAAFLIPRPKVSFLNLLTYGLCIGVGQFGLLYYAIEHAISPGMASLVIQTQVFFSIALSILLEKERLNRVQILALLICASGLGGIAFNVDAETTLFGLGLVLTAAMCWAMGNMASKRSGANDFLQYVVWSSALSSPLLFALSLYFEGFPQIMQELTQADWSVWASLLWQAWGNTLFGYAAWAWLLSKHPLSRIAPVTLLVPVFGMSASAILLSESMPTWKVASAGLILLGLLLNIWASARRNSA